MSSPELLEGERVQGKQGLGVEGVISCFLWPGTGTYSFRFYHGRMRYVDSACVRACVRVRVCVFVSGRECHLPEENVKNTMKPKLTVLGL